MTERDPLLEESNRAAHRVARVALRKRALWDLPQDSDEFLRYREILEDLNVALDAYEEIERRAQREDAN